MQSSLQGLDTGSRILDEWKTGRLTRSSFWNIHRLPSFSRCFLYFVHLDMKRILFSFLWVVSYSLVSGQTEYKNVYFLGRIHNSHDFTLLEKSSQLNSAANFSPSVVNRGARADVGFILGSKFRFEMGLGFDRRKETVEAIDFEQTQSIFLPKMQLRFVQSLSKSFHFFVSPYFVGFAGNGETIMNGSKSQTASGGTILGLQIGLNTPLWKKFGIMYSLNSEYRNFPLSSNSSTVFIVHKLLLQPRINLTYNFVSAEQ